MCVLMQQQILQCYTQELEPSLLLGGRWPSAFMCRVWDRVHKDFIHRVKSRDGAKSCSFLCFLYCNNGRIQCDDFSKAHSRIFSPCIYHSALYLEVTV